MKVFNLRRAMRAALLLLLMSAGVTKVFALENEFWVDNIHYYPYNSNTAWVTGCNAEMTTLNVPSTVTYNNHTYTVTEIYQNAFYGNTTLTDVILPNTMTMIGANAFKNCTNLTTVVLPEELTTLNSGAFQGCSNLQYFGKRVGNAYISPNELPSTLTTIYLSTFYGCTSLQSIRIPSSITEIQGNAFANCTNLEYVYVFGLTAPTLGIDVFSNTSSELNIYVPAASEGAYEAATNWSTYANHIKAMPAHEFLTYTFDTDNHTATVSGYIPGIAGDLVIPDAVYGFNVTAIAHSAFNQGTQLGITSVTFPQYLTNTGGATFGYCGSMTTADISRCTNLTELAYGTFAGCGDLTNIKWNKAITTIGNNVFNTCGFTTMEIPNTVTSIGEYAFNWCDLVSLTLPKSVEEIGKGAFQNNHLQDVYSYRSVPPTIDAETFTSDESFDCTLHVPCADYGMYYDATGWEKFTNIVEMELNTLYYSYEESNHTATVVCYAGYPIGEVTIPETVTHNNETYTVTNIGEGAFRYAGSITKINLPSTIVAIDDYAFADCNDLTSLTLPAVTSNIGDYVFQGCTSLEYIVALEPTAPLVHEHTFDGLARIPLYVSEAAYDSFDYNSYWHDSFILNRPGLIYNTETTTAVVAGCTPHYIGAVEIPAAWGQFNVVGIKWSAFNDQPYITSISIPASVTNIEFGAIMNCESLQSITLAAGNTSYKTDATGALLTMDNKGLIAFPCGKTITSYDIPEGVEQTWHVFDGNKSLQTIYIPRSLTFGNDDFQVEHAFYGLDCLTTLTVPSDHPNYQANNGVLLDKNGTKVIYCPRGKAGSYAIPNTVTTVDRGAFYGCKNLTNVTIPNTVSTIEANAFRNCESLTSVVIPTGIVTDGDKTIESEAFRHCTSLTAISIPDGIIEIKSGAFAETGITSLYLPASVTALNEGFYDCLDLSVITCDATTPPTGDAWTFDLVATDIPVYVPYASLGAYQQSEVWNRFTNIQANPDASLNLVYSYNDSDLTATVTGYTGTISGDLVIPGMVKNDNKTYTVTAIADETFKNCTELTSVTTPHTLETIGASAFESCTGMESVVIGRNVKSIGSYAFKYCYALVNIDYYAVNCGRLNTTIWYDAFASNKNLTIRNSVKSIPDYAFFHLPGLTSVTIPNSTESIGEYAFAGNSQLASFTMGSNVKTIGYYAFRSSGITSIDLLNVETVGEGIFEDCTELQTVTLRNSLSTLKNKMFNGCTSLNNVHIPSGVRIIGNEAFKGCTSLTNLVFDNPFQGLLTTIGESAFESCGLTSVDIPSTVTTVETWAFYGNTNLTTVTIGTGMQYMGSNLFYNCTSLATVNYNATHCNTIASSFGSNTGGATKTLHIGNNVSYIPGNAFAGLNLASVTIPNGVTAIGEYAFYDCANITEINIPNSVTYLGEAAFAGNRLETITLGSGLVSIGDYAFGTDESTPYLETITSYNVTPPTIFEHTFNSIDYSNATLYVLGATAEAAYGSADYWENFNTIQSMEGYYFTGATNSNWGTATNWSTGEVPTSDCINSWNPEPSTINVFIMADATVNIENAFAFNFTIMDDNVVTVTNGNKLRIGCDAGYGQHGSFTAPNASALIIEDGGQLWNDVDVQATVEKDVAGYGSGSDNWNFIASPIGEFYDLEADWLNPMNVENMVDGTFDLYRFDQLQYQAEWQNYKVNSFSLRNGWGYLYANADDVTLEFAGTVKSNADGREVSLEYTTESLEVPVDPENPEAGYNYESYPFAGWNLVGNPFACDAYLGGSNYQSHSYYKMNSTGNGIEAVENLGAAIPSCTGIFVKASSETGITFLRELDPYSMSAPNNGSLQIALEQPTLRGVSEQIDNAIVSFNEGSVLEKFVLFQDNARICIPQNGKDYAIVSSEGNGEMPINFWAADNGNYTITIVPSEVNMAYLHLIDNVTGADVNLLQTPSYTFDGGQSNYASRFRLVYSTEGSIDGNETFAYYNGSEWVINGTGTVQVVDMMGHIIICRDGVHTVSTSGMAPGVYVLRLVNGENVKVQKIVVR